MALDTNTLKSEIKNAYKAVQKEQNPDAAAEKLAQDISNAIEKFIKTGTVAFTPGNVVGTCAGPGNPLTAGAATGGEIS